MPCRITEVPGTSVPKALLAAFVYFKKPAYSFAFCPPFLPPLLPVFFHLFFLPLFLSFKNVFIYLLQKTQDFIFRITEDRSLPGRGGE